MTSPKRTMVGDAGTRKLTIARTEERIDVMASKPTARRNSQMAPRTPVPVGTAEDLQLRVLPRVFSSARKVEELGDALDDLASAHELGATAAVPVSALCPGSVASEESDLEREAEQPAEAEFASLGFERVEQRGARRG